MAKVVGPLFSVDARGKVADSLVFSGWRGIKTVRRWLKPHNPDTLKQRKTRQQFSNAVSTWGKLTVSDQNAWRKSASGKPLSGFNQMVGLIKKALHNELGWLFISSVESTPGAAGSNKCTINFNVEDGDTGPGVTVLYGRSESLSDGEVKEGSTPSATPTIELTDLIPATTYFFRIVSSAPDTSPGQSGIYTFDSPLEE